MLQELHIRHLLLIRHAQLELAQGLNILSGESGAGKSLVLQAIALLLGARFDKDLLSPNQASGSVIGVWQFPTNHPVWLCLDQFGIPFSPEESLLIRRQFGQNAGVFVNDTPVQLRALTHIGKHMAEMYGQFAAHRLSEADYQRKLLDDFGGLNCLLKKAKDSFHAFSGAKENLAREQQRYEQLVTRADYVEHVLQELEALNLREDELEALHQQRLDARAVVARQDTIAQAIKGFEKAGFVRNLDQIQSSLISADDTVLSEVIEGLERARIELGEAERNLSLLGSSSDFLETDLNSIEERLFRISELARKHQVAPENLLSVQDELAREASEIENTAKQIQQLQKVLQECDKAVQEDHEALSRARSESAKQFEKTVNQEFPHLNMPQAKLSWLLQRRESPTASGSDWVNLLLQTQSEVEPKALLKVASGGELSRILLAIALCMGQGSSVETNGMILVFDEVDAGMGGETAAALGGRLQILGEHRQILAVTHSPQMAARAGKHLGVKKVVEDAQLMTQVSALSGQERQEEIARMLAGETVTKAARIAADVLMKESTS